MFAFNVKDNFKNLGVIHQTKKLFFQDVFQTVTYELLMRKKMFKIKIYKICQTSSTPSFVKVMENMNHDNMSN